MINTLNDVDNLMKQAAIYYEKRNSSMKDLFQTVGYEIEAYQLLDSIKGKEADALKATLLQPSQTRTFMQLQQDPELARLQKIMEEKQIQYDNYMANQYYPSVNKDGTKIADAMKQLYSTQLDQAKKKLSDRYGSVVSLANVEAQRLVKGFPDRKKNYDNLRTKKSTTVYTMKDADDAMLHAYDDYLNGNQKKQLEYEVNAYSILDSLDGQTAKRLKATLLQPAQFEDAIVLEKNNESAQATYLVKKQQYDVYMSQNYALNVQSQGQVSADATKVNYATQKDRAQALYQAATSALNKEYAYLTKGFPLRKKNYDLTKLEIDSHFDQIPEVEMNTILSDLMVAYPEQNANANRMNQQVQRIYDNYQVDISYATILDELIVDLSDNGIPKIQREIQYKKRTADIQEYYNKNYTQQIVLLKIILVFSLLALFGGLLMNYQLVSASFFAVYLGVVLSIGFIMLFYYLWDFYLRDTTNFDEYQFFTYHPPPKPPLKNDLHDNVIYCPDQ